MLEVDGLRKRYGEHVALDGLSLRAQAGRLCGFLGANGAGKTTTMRCIFGIVRPDAGCIRWRGRPVGARERTRFGYLPEQRGLYPKMRLAEQLTYHGRLHGMSRPNARHSATVLLAELGLSDRSEDRVEALSHGNQQRVQLAAALVHDPELLVLDEPFSGLDPLGVEAMAALLRARAGAGATVVFSSHQLDLVENLCDDVVLIDEGRLVLQGALSDVRSSSASRVVEVTFSSATNWSPPVSPESGPAVRRDVHRHRVVATVPAELELEAVVASARSAGDVTDFTFRPPTLAEIFRERVRR